MFTIPKRLRLFFRYDRKLLGELASCAWRALEFYFEVSVDGADVRPGAVGFLQTAGELLNFHPHVHILVTDGGFGPDRGFRHLPRLNSRHLERLFQAEVLRMLMDKGLIGEETVRNLLTWRHSGFSVHGAVRVEGRQGAARLGRYMIRCPLALNRLSWNEDTAEVAYTARPTRRSRPRPTTACWDVLDFIARVVDHIPQPSQQTIRYWGFYANAARGKRRKEFATARAIRRSLKLPTQEPEPLAHGPPHEFELLDQIA